MAPEETEEERKRSIEMKRLATSKMLLARKGLAAKSKQQGVCVHVLVCWHAEWSACVNAALMDGASSHCFSLC